jgi:hypothetical protein
VSCQRGRERSCSPVPHVVDWTTLPAIIRLQAGHAWAEFAGRYSYSHRTHTTATSIDCSTVSLIAERLLFFHLAFLWRVRQLDAARRNELHAAPPPQPCWDRGVCVSRPAGKSLRTPQLIIEGRVETLMFQVWQSKSTQGQELGHAPRYTCLWLLLHRQQLRSTEGARCALDLG